MSRWRTSLVYVGIRAHVIAFNRKTGVEVWRTKLPAKYNSATSIVNVFTDAEGLFATCAGEVFALDPRTGALLWHDPLKGMGTGVAIIASELGSSPQGSTTTAAEAARQAAAAQAAAT